MEQEVEPMQTNQGNAGEQVSSGITNQALNTENQAEEGKKRSLKKILFWIIIGLVALGLIVWIVK